MVKLIWNKISNELNSHLSLAVAFCQFAKYNLLSIKIQCATIAAKLTPKIEWVNSHRRNCRAI